MGNGRLAGSRRIRVGIWNVESLTRKFFELVDVLGIHKVDIACFQETKWKGSSTKEGNDYKLWYSGSPTARNGVAVILASCLKDNVLQVYKSSNRIMAVTLVVDGETVNELQWMDIHGFMDVLLTELGMMKEVRTQIDYLMVRKGDLRVCKDCRVYPGEQADRAIAEERYKVAKREAKKEVTHVKGKVYEDLCKKLDSKEEANDIYRIAKAHERRRRDLGSIGYIKDESGQSIVDEEGTRWGEYFFDLFNERRPEGRGKSEP
nr:cleavage/polyadenylation specificity factor, 25kDa subunit [Tanacetum cinerariifolium]